MKNKQGGVDGISAKILKCNIDNIASPLNYIYNLCSVKSIWPEDLKKAEVPIHKSGNQNLMNNYRPTSLISILAKVFEEIIHVRLTSFIDFHHLIHKFQYGFRKGYGTNNALAQRTEIIFENLNNNKCISATFFDLRKAFDTVDHHLLLNKLYDIGIRGTAHKLLADYIQNRTQFVKIDNVTSSTRKIRIGVPILIFKARNYSWTSVIFDIHKFFTSKPPNWLGYRLR